MTAHSRGVYCPNVTLLPTVPHEHMGDAVWARTGVLLAPSKAEAWGMAAVEALAHGIPVIAHPTPGLVESMGTGAWFLERDDLDQWETSLVALDEFACGPWLSGIARAETVQKMANDDAARFVVAVEGL